MSSDQIGELQQTIRRSQRVHVVGSQSKTGFHCESNDAVRISTQGLTGVVSYDPQEFVITVMSGTLVTEVIAVLAEQGQYLPFDPLLSSRLATIGGTVCANSAGSGRFRFGGIRDFLIGVRFIDGRGNCIRGGGQVVKNAAGFDYPKLMVGSRGTLGLVYELTFKVFPRPESFVTVISQFSELNSALVCMNQLASSAMDLEAIDLVPNRVRGGVYELVVRLGGIATAIPNRVTRLQKWFPAACVLHGADDSKYWVDSSDMAWVSDTTLLKLPITSSAIPELEQLLAAESVVRRYCVGGNVAWIAGPWRSDWPKKYGVPQVFLGKEIPNSEVPKAGPFGIAIKRALDPEMKLV